MRDTECIKKKVMVFEPITQDCNGDSEEIKKMNISEKSQYFHDAISIQEIYAIEEESGICLSKLTHSTVTAPNEDLFSNFVSAINAFKNELLNKTQKDLEGIDVFNLEFNGLTITVMTNELLRIVINSKGRFGELMTKKCANILMSYEKKHYSDLAFFNGCVDSFRDFPQFVRTELDWGLNEKCWVNIENLIWLDSTDDLKRLMIKLYKSSKSFLPVKLAILITKMLDIDPILANYYIYMMWTNEIIVPDK